MSCPAIWNALIRTHHITSRKKVAKLRAAASNYHVWALLRSGGCPGIMYCEGREADVKDWVATVQRLRYKDFQLVAKPGAKIIAEHGGLVKQHSGGESRVDENLAKAEYGKLEEVDTVKEFGSRMQGLGAWVWWRKGMGYVNED